MRLNKAEKQKHLTHNFPFLCRVVLDWNGCGALRFVVSDAVYFSFKKGRLMCDDTLSLEYYEAKIQMLSVFSWKPALEMPRYVEIQIFLFLKLRSKK